MAINPARRARLQLPAMLSQLNVSVLKHNHLRARAVIGIKAYFTLTCAQIHPQPHGLCTIAEFYANTIRRRTVITGTCVVPQSKSASVWMNAKLASNDILMMDFIDSSTALD